MLEKGKEDVPTELKHWEKPLKEILVSPEQVEKSISALKKVAQWNAQGKESSTPLFKDKSATIYLQFTPGKPRRTVPKLAYFGTKCKVLNLVHPLSCKRNMCYVTGDDEPQDKIAQVVKDFRELGVQGEIKILPEKAFQAAIKKDPKMNDYDAFVATLTVATSLTNGYLHGMSPEGKFMQIIWDKKDGKQQKLKLKQLLTESNFCTTPANDAYVLKVAHTAHTDAQIKENIVAVLERVSRWRAKFPQGLKHFKSVHLKTGTSGMIPLYKNDGDVFDELKDTKRRVFYDVDGGFFKRLREVKKEKKRLKAIEKKKNMEISKTTDVKAEGDKKKSRKTKKMGPSKSKKAQIKAENVLKRKSPEGEESSLGTQQKKQKQSSVATPVANLAGNGTPKSSGRKRKNRRNSNKTPGMKVVGSGTPNSAGK